MKKLVLAMTLFTMISSSLFSQNKKIGLTLQVSNPIRDAKVGWFDIDAESIDGYDVKDNSYALGILGTYKKSSMTNFRLRVNFTKIGIEEYRHQSAGGIYSSELMKGNQNKVTLSPGIAWSLTREKLDVYFGIEIPFTLQGKFDLDYKSIQIDSVSGSVVSDSYTNQEISNGYSVGMGGIFGFNYFISPKFSVGAEFSPSLLFSKLGGEIKGKTFSTTPPQSNVGASQEVFKGFTHYENRFSFGISLWL